MVSSAKRFAYCKVFAFVFAFILLAGLQNAVTTVTPFAPAAGAYLNTTSITFTFNFTSNNSSSLSCTVYANGTVVGSNATTLNNTQTSIIATGNASLADGFYLWNVSCTGNATSISSTQNFTKDTVNPAVTIGFPASGYNSSSRTLTINVTATDANLNYTNVSIYNAVNALVNSTKNSSSGLFSISLSVPADGIFTINATAYDYATNSNMSGVSSIMVDTTAPVLTINSPVNNTNTSSTSPTFNWTAADALRTTIACNLTVDGAVNRSSLSVTNGTAYTNTAASAFSQGKHSWSITCWDDLNNAGSSGTYNFTVDTTAPVVTLNAPANLTNTTSNTTIFNFTATDNIAPAMNCSLYINGVLNISNTTTLNSTATNFTLAGMPNGIFNWYISCTDPSTNTGASGVYVLTVDSTAPVLTINAPANNTNTSNTNPTFNWTAADALRTTIACNLTVDGALNRSSLSVTNGTAYTNTATSAFSQGTHSWSVTCWDDLNNSRTSGTYSFIVDTTAPVVTLNAPANNSQTTNGSGTTFSFTPTDNIAPTTNCSFYLGVGTAAPTLNATNASIANNTAATFSVNLSNGVWTWYALCTDFAGNTGTFGNVSYLVDSSNTSYIANTTVNVTQNNTAVVVAPGSPPSSITVGSSSTNVTLNTSAVYNNSTYSSTLPSAINVSATTADGAILVQIPANDTINAASDWSGTMNLPYVASNSSYTPVPESQYGLQSVQDVIEVGLPSVQLNLSSSARLLFPGEANLLVGYTRSGAGVFTPIGATCTSDNQSVVDAQLTGAIQECKINSGSDLVVWTKHFTQFVTYSEYFLSTPGVSSSTGDNGGGSGGSVSGGIATTGTDSSTSAYQIPINGASCPVSVDRSITSTDSLSTVTTTLVNNGGAGCTLSDFVFTDTVPTTFANMSEISFSAQYSSQNGQAVTFGFPSFAPGESKTLSYSVQRWAKTSSVSDFTAYSMSAKAPAPAAPSAPQQNAAPPVKNPAPAAPQTDSHGCYVSEGYAWCAATGGCLAASVPCKAPAPAASAPASAAPAAPAQTQGSLLPLAIAAIIVIAILALGAAALGLFGKKKKGLDR